jgi:hypothetical protein
MDGSHKQRRSERFTSFLTVMKAPESWMMVHSMVVLGPGGRTAIDDDEIKDGRAGVKTCPCRRRAKTAGAQTKRPKVMATFGH